MSDEKHVGRCTSRNGVNWENSFPQTILPSFLFYTFLGKPVLYATKYKGAFLLKKKMVHLSL